MVHVSDQLHKYIDFVDDDRATESSTESLIQRVIRMITVYISGLN